MSTPSTRAPCRKWTICSVPGGRFAVAILRCLGSVCTVGATFLTIKRGRYLPAVRAAAFLLSDFAEMKACVHGVCATGGLNTALRAVTADHTVRRYCASRVEPRRCHTFNSIHPGMCAVVAVRSRTFALINLRPACLGDACGSRSQTTVAPFCSSCLQSG